MARPWLIYGAYGYTGRLIAELAVARGHAPVLGGRDRRKTAALAGRLGLDHLVFDLDDPAAIRAGLDGMAAVLNVAGPFLRTYRQMAQACCERRCHYLDVTGEIDVFEGLHALDAPAREAGVALLPGVGFDVVPTDCAAARAAALVDSPCRLDIAFLAGGGASRGTSRTMIQSLNGSSRIRRDGLIVDVPFGSVRRQIPFSDRERHAVAIPWGDVSTAFHSTGIPDIRVFQPISPQRLQRVSRWLPLASTALARRVLSWWVGRISDGPSEQQRRLSRARIWCEAGNNHGESARVELTCPNGYSLTADAAVTALSTLLGAEGDSRVTGFVTPSLAFGSEFVDRLVGIEWVADSN